MQRRNGFRALKNSLFEEEKKRQREKIFSSVHLIIGAFSAFSTPKLNSGVDGWVSRP